MKLSCKERAQVLKVWRDNALLILNQWGTLTLYFPPFFSLFNLAHAASATILSIMCFHYDSAQCYRGFQPNCNLITKQGPHININITASSLGNGPDWNTAIWMQQHHQYAGFGGGKKKKKKKIEQWALDLTFMRHFNRTWLLYLIIAALLCTLTSSKKS